MKLKLEKVTHYTTDQEGKELVSKKSGKPYTRCIIIADNKRYSGFGSQVTRDWKEGDTVEVEVESKTVGENTYLNFKLPNPYVTRAEHQEVIKRIEVLEDFIQGPQVDKPQEENPFEPEENVA